MTVAQTLFPYIFPQFFDNNGDPLNGGTLEFYLAGSATPQDTWSDEDLTVLNSNPLSLNSAGRPVVSATEVSIYPAQNVAYKVIIKNSAGTTVRTIDHIVPNAPEPVDLATQVTNVLPVANGGTGLSSGQTFDAICQGRLTLTTLTPVTTADVTGATTIFFTPYKGNIIALYDGSTRWNARTFTELSVALGTLTSGLPYDVFCFDNAGTPALRSPVAWSSATARATALVTQNGVLVKTGATTDRYLGTFVTTSTTQTEDSNANRLLYNYYNRQRRPLLVTDTTSSWNYSLAQFRQARATATNQVTLCQGVAESPVFIRLHGQAANDTGTMNINIGIGEDSTSTALSAQTVGDGVIGGANFSLGVDAFLEKIPAVGKHTYVWLEAAEATGTTTWRGASTSTGGAATTSGVGMTGWCEA